MNIEEDVEGGKGGDGDGEEEVDDGPFEEDGPGVWDNISF